MMSAKAAFATSQRRFPISVALPPARPEWDSRGVRRPGSSSPDGAAFPAACPVQRLAEVNGSAPPKIRPLRPPGIAPRYWPSNKSGNLPRTVPNTTTFRGTEDKMHAVIYALLNLVEQRNWIRNIPNCRNRDKREKSYAINSRAGSPAPFLPSHRRRSTHRGAHRRTDEVCRLTRIRVVRGFLGNRCRAAARL